MDSNENKKVTKKLKKLSSKLIVVSLVIILVVTAGFTILPIIIEAQKNKAEIITVSTLEKLIDINELSTFQAVYNGIAKVMNEKKPSEIDYYVSYKAKVYAGFDFKQVEISLNEELKKITVTIPKILLTDVTIDIASLDYMFENEKANASTVSAQAFDACKEDAKKESEEEAAIFDLAAQNAKNIMKALISPFMEQLDSDYELEILLGGL